MELPLSVQAMPLNQSPLGLVVTYMKYTDWFSPSSLPHKRVLHNFFLWH